MPLISLTKNKQQQNQPANQTRKSQKKSQRRRMSRKKSVEDFQFGSRIGEGSYSSVYKGVDVQSRKVFAIKVLSKKHIVKEKKIKYVNIEKITLNRLGRHPGIVTLYYTFQDENSLYFVIDLAEHGELLTLIRKLGSLSEKCSRYYMIQLIDAVDFMHKKGVIHRDLKPENILVNSERKLMITDFGAAKVLNLNEKGEINVEDESIEESFNKGSFVGTAEYVSPELLKYNKCGFESDLWAIGCILFQFIVGLPPFKGQTEYQTFEKIVELNYKWPNFYIPEHLKDLVSKLLRSDPKDRLNMIQIQSHPWFNNLNWNDKSKIWGVGPPNIEPYRPLVEQTLNQNHSRPMALTKKLPASTVKKNLLNSTINQIRNDNSGNFIFNTPSSQSSPVRQQQQQPQQPQQLQPPPQRPAYNGNGGTTPTRTQIPPFQQSPKPIQKQLLVSTDQPITPNNLNEFTRPTKGISSQSMNINGGPVTPTPIRLNQPDSPSVMVKQQNHVPSPVVDVANQLERRPQPQPQAVPLPPSPQVRLQAQQRPPQAQPIPPVQPPQVKQQPNRPTPALAPPPVGKQAPPPTTKTSQLRAPPIIKPMPAQQAPKLASKDLPPLSLPPKTNVKSSPATSPQVKTQMKPQLTNGASKPSPISTTPSVSVPKSQPPKIQPPTLQMRKTSNSNLSSPKLPRPKSATPSPKDSPKLNAAASSKTSTNTIKTMRPIGMNFETNKNLPGEVSKRLQPNEHIIKLDYINLSELVYSNLKTFDPNSSLSKLSISSSVNRIGLDDVLINEIITKNQHELSKTQTRIVLAITDLGFLHLFKVVELDELNWYLSIDLTDKLFAMYDYEFSEFNESGFLILEILKIDSLKFLSPLSKLVKFEINEFSKILIGRNISWIDSLLKTKELMKYKLNNQSNPSSNNSSNSNSNGTTRNTTPTNMNPTSTSPSTNNNNHNNNNNNTITSKTKRNSENSSISGSSTTKSIRSQPKPKQVKPRTKQEIVQQNRKFAGGAAAAAFNAATR